MEPDTCTISIKLEQHNNGITVFYNDNGIGLTAETRHHIFEPFFTTKRHSGGSGLGMYIVMNLIKNKLKGTIELKENGPGFGCKIWLPTTLD